MARDLPSRFRFRAVAGAIDVPHGCPPLRHSIAARGRTEAALGLEGIPFLRVRDIAYE